MTKTRRQSKRSKAKFSNEVLDLLLKDGHSPEDILGPDGLLKQLTAALVTRVMEVEATDHLGYEVGEVPPEEQTNRRNGHSDKTLRTGKGPRRMRRSGRVATTTRSRSR